MKMDPTCTPPLWNPGKLPPEMARDGVNPYNLLSFNKASIKQRADSSGSNVSPQEKNHYCVLCGFLVLT